MYGGVFRSIGVGSSTSIVHITTNWNAAKIDDPEISFLAVTATILKGKEHFISHKALVTKLSNPRWWTKKHVFLDLLLFFVDYQYCILLVIHKEKHKSKKKKNSKKSFLNQRPKDDCTSQRMCSYSLLLYQLSYRRRHKCDHFWNIIHKERNCKKSFEPDLNQRPKDDCTSQMMCFYSLPLYQLSYRRRYKCNNFWNIIHKEKHKSKKKKNCKKSFEPDLNQRPKDDCTSQMMCSYSLPLYQLSYRRRYKCNNFWNIIHKEKHKSKKKKNWKKILRAGFEPAT